MAGGFFDTRSEFIFDYLAESFIFEPSREILDTDCTDCHGFNRCKSVKSCQSPVLFSFISREKLLFLEHKFKTDYRSGARRWAARCRPPEVVGKPIETGCSRRKIHITALVLKIRPPGFAGHSFVNPFKASWNCRWHFMLRCAWQGCYGSAQKQPLPFLLANARFASRRPLGIHEAEHQAFGFSGG